DGRTHPCRPPTPVLDPVLVTRTQPARAMAISDLYRKPDDLPQVIPVFPLGGALLLPRGQLPLNIFEPRYLAMVNDAMSADRIVGMIQPASDEALALQDDPAATPSLCGVGCAGRITSFTETGDGRILITLTGIARFHAVGEIPTLGGYRRFRIDASPFADDFCPGAGQ